MRSERVKGTRTIISSLSFSISIIDDAIRIFDIIETKSKINIVEGIWPDPKSMSSQGSIEFKDVSFSYPTREDVVVLQDFSLKIEPNQTVALVGPSGSGKSTTLCLLERFYDVSKGEIVIDGYNIKDLDPRYWTRLMSQRLPAN
jgi:ABC-type multidrug transport system fused ATPase/permease subunit